MPATAALAALAAALASAAGPQAVGTAPLAAGRYALHGTVHVDAAALPGRDGSADFDVVVAPGAAPDGVRLRAASRGYTCELAARLRGGELAFDGGQACAVDVDEPDARGHVDARLRSGRGRLAGGALQLDLAFDLSGALSTRVAGQRVNVLGREVALPEGWTPKLPVRGALTTSATGQRAAGAAPSETR